MQHVFITGASSGLGQALARRYAADGARLGLLGGALGRGHSLYTSYEYAKGSKLTLPWTLHLGYRYTW
nr:SDR family NAD(P)-dependent oxidoreductase [Bordetella parapertussis]